MTTVTRGRQAPISLPFPSQVNPRVETLCAHLDQRARRRNDSHSDARPAESDIRFGQLVGRMYPTAEPPLMELTGDAVLWLFLYDDHLDPGAAGDDPEYSRNTANLVADVLIGPRAQAPADPLLDLLWRLREQLRPLAPPDWWQRFADDVAQFAQSLDRELRSRRLGPPDARGYLEARRFTSGWPILTDLVELNDQVHVPDEIRASQCYEEMRWASCDVACTINDALSLHKEIAAGEEHNLILILQRAHRCELPEATDLAFQWMDRRLGDYLDMRASFLAAGKDAGIPGAMARYTAGLESLMRGSLDWSMETGRYTTEEPT